MADVEDGIEAGIEQHEQQPDRSEIERKAREAGWWPKEKWRGNPEQWVDADRFIEIANQSLPLIKSQLSQERQRNEQAQRRLHEQQTDFDRRLKALDATTRTALDMQKRELLRQFEAEKEQALAIEDPQQRAQAYRGAVRREADAFNHVAQAEQEISRQSAPPVQQNSQIPAEIQEWGKRNPWLNYVPPEIRQEAVDVMASMEAADQQHEQSSLVEKLNAVAATIRRRHPAWFPPDQVQGNGRANDDIANGETNAANSSRRAVSSVAGGSGMMGSRGQTKAKDFKALPTEFKSAFNGLIKDGRLGHPKKGEDLAKWQANLEAEYARNAWAELE